MKHRFALVALRVEQEGGEDLFRGNERGFSSLVSMQVAVF
jgi:hypothetical protein